MAVAAAPFRKRGRARHLLLAAAFESAHPWNAEGVQPVEIRTPLGKAASHVAASTS
jgi:hypothetical protein